MESISIAGRCTRDAETRTVGSDMVLSFSIAVNKKVKGVESTRFYDCAVWGEKRATVLAPMIKKGDRIAVSGEFGTHEHNGKIYLKIRVNEVSLLEGKRDGAPAPLSKQDESDVPF